MQENEIKMRDAVIAMITRMAEHRSVDVAYAAAPALKRLPTGTPSTARQQTRRSGSRSGMTDGSLSIRVPPKSPFSNYTCFPPEANRWLTAASVQQ